MSVNSGQKVRRFVEHLLSLPNIKNEPPVIREGLILSFITENRNQIRATLSSPGFFPELNPDEALKKILQFLRQVIIGQITPQVEDWTSKRIRWGVVQKLYPSAPLTGSDCRSKLLSLINTMLLSGDARYNFNSVMNIFGHNVLDRYIPRIFERRGAIFQYLKRVEGNPLEMSEYIEFAKLVFLIKNAVYMHIPFMTRSGKAAVNITQLARLSISHEKFMTRIEQRLVEAAPFLTKDLIQAAVKSNLSVKATGVQDASARLFFIFSSRYQEYKHIGRIDRVAETSDKSWFTTARRNADYYGFDEKMVDELYLIAGDNMW